MVCEGMVVEYTNTSDTSMVEMKSSAMNATRVFIYTSRRVHISIMGSQAVRQWRQSHAVLHTGSMCVCISKH